MDFLKENKTFAVTSLAAAVFGAYVLKESLRKLRRGCLQASEDVEEEKLAETVKKIMESPEKIHGESSFKPFKDSHQIHSTPLYKICLTGGPCGGKTTGFDLLLYIYIL